MTMAMVNALRFADEDSKRQRRLIYQLRTAGDLRSVQLASGLERCTEGQPCGSGACILCGRKLQLAATGLIGREIRLPAQRTLRGRMSAIAIIPASGVVVPGELTAEVLQTASADIATAIRTCAIAPAVCGLDVSFNEDEEGEVPDHWVAHIHAVVADWLSKADEEALRALVEPSPLVRRRVRVEKLDGRADGPLYAVKPDRGRRVGYINDKNFSRKPFRDTHRRDLRPWQAVALAHAEHELGLINRLIITGIRDNTVRAALKGLYWPQDGP